MLTVHHLENSQSIRILWLLEELEADYRIQLYQRTGPNTMAPEEYKNLHPMGTSPTISDGDTVLAETNAIIDYILDKFPNDTLRPLSGSHERTRYLFWLHATQGSFMPLLLESLIFKRMVSNSPALIRPVSRLLAGKIRESYLEPRLSRILKHMEDELSRSTWLAGEHLTAADIVMGYCLEVTEVRIGLGKHFPNIKGFLRRMRERPAYKAAMEKNGDFKPLAS